VRRRQIIFATGAAVATQFGGTATAAAAKPQVGDVLAHAFGEQAGSLIVSEDVADGLLFAFPMAADGVLRSSSLHNQVALLRVDEARMSDQTRGYAAGPFVAVSAACTHTGCEVSGWVTASSELECPCHGSRFDVLDAARVVNGPATKPLAYLPIELTDDVFRVAGRFSRRVGPPPAY
jgi:rieske iron-sulfur protein